MIDTTTHESIQVVTHGGDWPYIIMPLTRLDPARALLDANQVSYWVDAEALSLDGKPEVTFINFARGTDPAMVQCLLDSIS